MCPGVHVGGDDHVYHKLWVTSDELLRIQYFHFDIRVVLLRAGSHARKLQCGGRSARLGALAFWQYQTAAAGPISAQNSGWPPCWSRKLARLCHG